MPVMSVVMPVASGCSPSRAIRALVRSLKRPERLELLVVEGNHPARQRNLAAARASSQFLYFLDHDAKVGEETPMLVLRALAAGAAAAGGPNVGVPGRSLFRRAGELVLGSWLGSPLVSARYAPRGGDSPAGEKSLILCNLAVKKAVFDELGGFDPRLYPNEENEFLNRLGETGRKAVYLPKAWVRKPRWGSLQAFLRENFRYGRGRLEQIWVNAFRGDAVFALILGLAAAFPLVVSAYPLVWWLAGVYLALVGVEAARLAVFVSKSGENRMFLWSFASFLTVSRHFAYLGGMFFGGMLGWRKRSVGSTSFCFNLKVFSVSRDGATLISREELQIGPVPAKVNTLC